MLSQADLSLQPIWKGTETCHAHDSVSNPQGRRFSSQRSRLVIERRPQSDASTTPLNCRGTVPCKPQHHNVTHAEGICALLWQLEREWGATAWQGCEILSPPSQG